MSGSARMCSGIEFHAAILACKYRAVYSAAKHTKNTREVISPSRPALQSHPSTLCNPVPLCKSFSTNCSNLRAAL